MEAWVHEWVQAKRGDGERGIEIKRFGNSYYVYRSTTFWDKEAKKRRKRSIYLGKLDKERGFIEREIPSFKPKSVRQYGNAMVLHRAMADILPLLRESFDKHWQEIYALAITRMLGMTPLKRVESMWERLYDPNKLTPKLSPKLLATILRDVGTDWSGQSSIFRELARNGRQFVYDLSVVFTRSEGVNFAELGYNKDHMYLPQIQLALLYAVDTGLPTMIRALPGSVKDITTLTASLGDVEIKGKILILDRGFYSEDVVALLLQREIAFLLPARRNSPLYEVRIHLTKHFFYRDRLIRYGKRRHEGYFLYLFEDAVLRMEEEKTLYKRLDERKTTREELETGRKVAGRILILSCLDREGEEMFMMYKQRGHVETQFDSYKNVLHADRMYLQDDESVFGHLFISFLALYGYCKLEKELKKAGLLQRFSPADVLEEFSKVYLFTDGTREVVSEIPRKVADLEAKLGGDVFPK
jgi:transposase